MIYTDQSASWLITDLTYGCAVAKRGPSISASNSIPRSNQSPLKTTLGGWRRMNYGTLWDRDKLAQVQRMRRLASSASGLNVQSSPCRRTYASERDTEKERPIRSTSMTSGLKT